MGKFFKPTRIKMVIAFTLTFLPYIFVYLNSFTVPYIYEMIIDKIINLLLLPFSFLDLQLADIYFGLPIADSNLPFRYLFSLIFLSFDILIHILFWYFISCIIIFLLRLKKTEIEQY